MRNVQPLELLSHVAAGRTCQQNEELGNLGAEPGDHIDEHVGALDELRLQPGGESDAVLLERSDHERGLGHAERGAGS